MAIAGAVVIPVNDAAAAELAARLAKLPGLEVQGIGPRGIAVVLEAPQTKDLERLSEEVLAWEEVADFQLGYCNWE